jgi:hypothetical protein
MRQGQVQEKIVYLKGASSVALCFLKWAPVADHTQFVNNLPSSENSSVILE